MTELLEKKYDELKKLLRSYGKVAVAFSSGVDSTFLLYAAKEAFAEADNVTDGTNNSVAFAKNVIAVTISADFVAEREKDEAGFFCKEQGIEHVICNASLSDIAHFSENPPDRCYYCKHHIFENILKIAAEHGISTVAEGSNLDDNSDYRPGHKAIAELGIKSPLRECGFTKAEIREVSRHLGLPTWSKPSFACLASRIPYGNIITSEKLSMIDKAEDLLFSLGFSQFRVRHHGDIARIELMPEDFPRFMEDNVRMKVYENFKTIGFGYVALDIKGYRTGSLNEGLSK
ncbi:MAG: ATP-dependent sacrificial sulfur transferase LarE [Butyrivibrio sp.]|nr:ATP-dependent sacrificial sulfur transferase LarE [Butyrivibrio sp.]